MTMKERVITIREGAEGRVPLKRESL